MWCTMYEGRHGCVKWHEKALAGEESRGDELPQSWISFRRQVTHFWAGRGEGVRSAHQLYVPIG